jgi:hypothetical protein
LHCEVVRLVIAANEILIGYLRRHVARIEWAEVTRHWFPSVVEMIAETAVVTCRGEILRVFTRNFVELTRRGK